MISDDLKQQIRDAYYSEYTDKYPPGENAQSFYVLSAMLFGGGFFSMIGGMAVAFLGVASAPLVALGGALAMAAGFCGGLLTASFDRAAGEALDRDIDNGALVDRYRADIIKKLSPEPANAPPTIDEAAIKDAFNKPAAENAAAQASVPRPPMLLPPPPC